MSLRIDEDKMGLGRRGNNLWGSLWAVSLTQSTFDRLFPHVPASS